MALILKNSGDFPKSQVTVPLYPEGCRLYPNVRGVNEELLSLCKRIKAG